MEDGNKKGAMEEGNKRGMVGFGVRRCIAESRFNQV
jgi:hypothetical protein